jgi:hypothetical protein
MVVIERSPSIQGIPNKASPTRHPQQVSQAANSAPEIPQASKSEFSQQQQGHFSGHRRRPQVAQSGFSANPCAAADAVMHAASRSTNEQMHVAKAAHGE